MKKTTEMKPMKIGELAKQTNLSIRSLRHYDEIGLLRPSRRTDSGHRLYGEEDVQRLQKVLSFKQVGFSLEEISSALGDPAISVLDAIEKHAESVEEEIEKQKKVLKRLQMTSGLLRVKEKVDVQLIFETIREIVLLQDYLSEEEMSIAEEAMKSDTVVKRFIEGWPAMLEEINALIKSKADPSSARSQAIAQTFMDIDRHVKNKKADFAAGAKNMLSENKETFEKLYGFSDEVMEFIKATTHVIKEKEKAKSLN